MAVGIAGRSSWGSSRASRSAWMASTWTGPDILKTLNERLGAWGVGRHIYTGDVTIGLKGRIAFECPGHRRSADGPPGAGGHGQYPVSEPVPHKHQRPLGRTGLYRLFLRTAQGGPRGLFAKLTGGSDRGGRPVHRGRFRAAQCRSIRPTGCTIPGLFTRRAPTGRPKKRSGSSSCWARARRWPARSGEDGNDSCVRSWSHLEALVACDTQNPPRKIDARVGDVSVTAVSRWVRNLKSASAIMETAMFPGSPCVESPRCCSMCISTRCRTATAGPAIHAS